MLANASQGNEVIVIEPNYDAYEPVIFLAGGIPIRVRMMPPDDNHQTFWVDWNQIAVAITKKTHHS